ncbi:hypothetical protein MHU86_11518 [Fragilaria crotonensis]|nr:hypothetical protein MHU86_11518 [Fragilaria crotonensis]
MPTQARDSGSVSVLWSCDCCGAQDFQTFEQVKAHELDCRKRQRPNAVLTQPSPPYGIMPPYAPQQPSPSKMRRYRLLEPGEGEGMDITDLTACQSLEVFEADHQNVADAVASAGESITLGQLGIRCIHCLPGTAYSTLYPQVTENLATCIQMLSDRHLSECSSAPARVREVCESTAVRRQRDHEQRRQPSEGEERCQMALLDHCRYFADNIGLVDKYPPKTGVVVGESGYRPMDAQPLPPRGPPHASIPFQAPPPRVGQMMADIAATPLARRNKHHGGDYPPASFMPQSADRNYPPIGEREGGYAAFQPHGSALRGYYAQDAPQDSRTPGMAQQPDPQQPPTPQAQHQDSPHSYPPVPHSPYEMPPPDFPYFQEMNGSWACRYCIHVHPQYREPGASWSSPSHSPPHGQFIDQHLSICRSYNQPPPPGYYDGPPPLPPYGYPPGPQYPPGPPPPGWSASGHAPPFPHPEGAYPPYMPPPPPSADQSNTMYPPHPLMEREPMPHRATRPPPRPPAAGMLSEAHDLEIIKAVDALVASDKQRFGSTPTERESRGSLVLDEDKLLLTDYFYHLMRQLRLCRFSEADRKTRGGKRENIKVGYGGLQCVHCSEAPNSRKFFWSNVDRLANSFAEIPGHVLKCRRCPVPIKNALMELKRRHPEQMARLPRGSQKVFFRRMWRRLHDEDAELLSESLSTDEGGRSANDENAAPKSKSPGKGQHQTDDSGQTEPCDSPDEGTLVIERSTMDAAKALADSSNLASPASPSSRVLLAISEDKEWLSDMDCFIRRNLEVFCATPADVEIAREDRKYPIHIGQVGIRCLHCAMAKGEDAARGTAVAFPYSINGIYESVREFQRLHLETCPHSPEATKAKLAGFKGSASLSSVLRKFYVLAAKALGMHDTPDGIRSGGESVPLGSSAASAFSFNDTVSTQGSKIASEHTERNSGDSVFLQTAVTPLESRKRKTTHPSDGSLSDESSKKIKAV